MKYFKNFTHLIDNYLLARLQNRPSTAQFWYIPEPPNLHSPTDLIHYQQSTSPAPLYLIDYRQKLNYTLKNKEGIIVLPYAKPIGEQINPEAAFQYALGLHDQFNITQQQFYLDQFFSYVDYFAKRQTQDGLWKYDFDWFTAKAPWYSALAQARGASVMLRAWLHTKNDQYLMLAKNALLKFSQPTSNNGFLHTFAPAGCAYFEEYPTIPTSVINGFMASLMGIWELQYWVKEKWLNDLWLLGISSLETMLPYYTNGWWSLYDLDKGSPIRNVNSPRYHLMEIYYLQILSILSSSPIIETERINRINQYRKRMSRLRALGLKTIRKTIYR